MKLLVDLSSCDKRYSSVTVYATRNLKGFRDNGYKDISIICNSNIYDYISSEFPDYKVLPINLSRSLSPLNVIRGYIKWRRCANILHCDVIYVPHPYPPYHCIYHKGKIITSFLDLQGVRLYSGIKLLSNRIVFSFVLKRSDKIITISDYVKEDVLGSYSFVDPNNVKTVYPSVIWDDNNNLGSPLDSKYILYVSSFMKHKNVMTLLKAFNRVKDTIEHKLVLIGQKNDIWYNIMEPFIIENSLSERIIQVSGISDAELASYYKHASLLVHTSLMEGFGYTPIEAAIYQIPVLSSKETALYETTKGLLKYYEPAISDEALSEAMIQILTHKQSNAELEMVSSQFKQEYDYKIVAQKLYNELNI